MARLFKRKVKKHERSGSAKKQDKKVVKKSSANKPKKTTKSTGSYVGKGGVKSNKGATHKKNVTVKKSTPSVKTQTPSFKPTKATHTQYESFKKSSFYNKPKVKKYDVKSDAKKGYERGKNKTYLGYDQKTTYTDLGKKKHATGRAKAQGNDRDKLKSVNALTKSEFERMVTASRLGKEQGNKLLKGGKRTGQKDIREKVGSKTAESAYKSKAATGVMQGMSKADIFSNAVGTYNKEAKKAIKKTKDSGAYMAGYSFGMAADMAMGGIGSKGASAAGVSGKVASKIAKKLGAKAVAKNSKSAVKTFAKNRAGELVAETPSNLLDAAKMSQDTNGKIDKKEFAKWATINTGLTTGVGGAIEGIGGKITKSQSKRVIELLKKQKNGGKLTAEEGKELSRLKSKLKKKSNNGVETVSQVRADKATDEINTTVKEGRLERGKAKSEGRADRVEAEYQKAKQGRYYNDIERIKDARDRKAAAQAKADSAGDYAQKQRTKDIENVSAKNNELETELENIQIAKSEAKTQEEYQRLVNREQTVKASIKNNQDKLAQAGVSETDRMTSKELNDTLKEVLSKKKKPQTMEEHQKLVDLEDRLKASLEKRQAKVRDEIATENQPVSEVKTASDTTTPKVAENPSKVAESPSAVTRRSETQNLNPEYSHMTDDELRAAIGEETKQGKGKWKHGANINAKAGIGGRTLPEGKKLQYEASEHFAKAKAMEKELAERNLPDSEIRLRETEQLRNELDNVNEEIRNKEAIINDEGDSGFFFSTEEKANLKKDLEDLNARKAELEQKIDPKTGERAYSAVSDEDVIIKNELDNAEKEVKATKPKETKRKGGVHTNKEIQNEIKQNDTVIDKISRGFFNSFRNWDKFVGKLDDVALRKKGLHLVQNVRMSRTKAVAKVYGQFTSIYKEAGLTKRGSKQKAEDFERYTYLMHDLERIDQDTEFLGLTENEIKDEINTLLKKYGGVDADGQVIETSEIVQFQEKVVKYFDELLDDDVKCGFDTAEGVASLRSKYNNYVPTYRDLDEMGSYSASNAIHFANKFEAKGGTEQPLKSLYDQAIDKTKLTTKRTALNDLVNFVADVNGVAAKDLPKGYEPDELMRASTLCYKDNSGHYITYWDGGKEQSLKISEGMYKGIRQWSGQDKLFFMEWKALNNKFVSGTNQFFKNWITDYSLVFGARNFIRDLSTGFFYSPHAISYARNIPRAIGCVIADSKPLQALVNRFGNDSIKAYVNTYADVVKAYKKNGGAFSQLVTSTNPEKLIRLNNGRNPLNWIREMNSMFETVPRLAEFCSVAEKRAMESGNISAKDWYNPLKTTQGQRKKLMAEALGNKDVIDEAMYRAKEATLNFDRSGYIGRWLNSGFVPFFNPSVQGLSKLARVLSKDTKTGAEWASMLAKFAVLGVGFEAGFQATIGATKEYQDISDYNKTAYFCIPMKLFDKDAKSTDFFKLPKAREVAAIQGGITWFFQHCKYHCAGKDERLFHSFLDVDIDKSGVIPKITASGNAKMWWEQIGPVNPLSDNLFFSPIRIASNKTWYGGYIENFDDEDMIKAGKSYLAKDEETSRLAYGISKGLNEGADKICGMLGFDKAQTTAVKSKVWSPKKWDNLMDSYLGSIYDMTIKQTSNKNHKLTDIVDSAKSGEVGEFGANIGKLLTSSWGNAFFLDTVVSNRHKQDMYQLKSDIKEEMQKALPDIETDGKKMMDIRDEVIDKYGYNSIEYKTFKSKYAEITRLNNSFAYNSVSYDEMTASIYNNDKLSTKQKDYWAIEIKKQQNALLDGRQNGKTIANADPMAFAYNSRKKDGKKLFTNDQVISMCTYTNKDGDNNFVDAYKSYKKNNKNIGKFMTTTLDMRDVSRRCGDSMSFLSYTIGNYVLADKEVRTGKSFRDVGSAYGMTDSDTDYIGQAHKYFTVGKGTLKNFITSHKAIVQGGIDMCKYENEMDSWDKCNILAKQTTSGKNGKKRKYLDRAFYAEGYYVLETMNYGRCLFSDKYKNSKWTPAKISEFCMKNGFTYKNDQKPGPDKVAKAIEKTFGKKYSREECAAIFGEICPKYTNPFGSVGDYSEKGDTGIQYDGWGSGYGYGGWGHGGGGGSSSSSSKVTTPKGSKKKASHTKVSYSATKPKVTDPFEGMPKSNLDDAYRRQLKKALKQ